MKVRSLRSNNYDINKFVIIYIYIPGKDGKIALITKELYIVNNLFIKILIGIDIIKPEEIIINTSKDLVTIISYNNLEIFISIITKGARINIIIINKFRYIILVYLDIVIIIKSIKSDLSYNCNLLFKLS
jgi:hypothetical protein